MYTELPFHIEKEYRKSLNFIINNSFGGKEAKNSSNYWKSLLVVTQWFQENHKTHMIQDILITLSEGQEIMYLPDNQRSLQTVLRLYLVMFVHILFIKVNVRGKVKKSTNCKFFGSYYCSLIRHSSEQYRIISGRAINTESEEVTFNSLKMFTNLTSNHHSDHVVVNALVRTQAKEALNPNKLHNLTDEKKFKNSYLPIKSTLCDTIISFTWIKRYFRDYQTLLENIADYLIDDTKWWVEEDSGVKFLDLSNISHTKELHHFRSSSIKTEEDFAKNCWTWI